jgi:hypothetical protein
MSQKFNVGNWEANPRQCVRPEQNRREREVKVTGTTLRLLHILRHSPRSPANQILQIVFNEVLLANGPNL